MRTRAADDRITDLRNAIDSLPVDTRKAMLAGVRRQPVVAGAYTDNDGGACPMLAAHRAGSRVALTTFARSWDAFARARRVRRATTREVRILEAQLKASILADTPVDLQAAIDEHQATRRRRTPADAVDFGAAIADHQASARNRRASEAAVEPQPHWWERPGKIVEDYEGALQLADAELARLEPALA